MVETASGADLVAEIVDRKSVVAFDNRPIEDSKIAALIEAARWRRHQETVSPGG